jgi:hypothetical protein
LAYFRSPQYSGGFPPSAIERRYAWTWGIDIVVPLRAHRSEGHAIDLKQCKTSFPAAWEFHCEEAGWLDEFLAG